MTTQHYSEWYFQDWREEQRIDSDGTQQRFFSYHGAYYQLPTQIPNYKAVQAACFLLALMGMLYLNLSFAPSPERVSRNVGAACMLSLAPTVFWAVGLLCLLPVSGPMTYRRYRRSLVRMRWGSVLACAVLTLAAVLEGAALLTDGILPSEVLRLLAIAEAWTFAGTAAVVSLRFPCERLEYEEVIK